MFVVLGFNTIRFQTTHRLPPAPRIAHRPRTSQARGKAETAMAKNAAMKAGDAI